MIHWIFHYSHDKIASLESFKSKVIDHYNYGLLLMMNSDDRKSQKMNQMALENLKSVAEEIRDKMMVSHCDVAKQALCRDIMVMFELEDHELPIVRMLYRMNDNSADQIGQEEIFYKFSFDRKFYKETIADIQNGVGQHEMMRVERDANGNIWLEDLTPEGFKTIAYGYGQGKLEVDMRTQKFSKENYNEAVLVYTAQNELLRIQDGLFYRFSSDTAPISISTQSLLGNSNTVFMRRLSFICFKRLAKESRIHEFKVNQAKIILIYNSKVLGERQTQEILTQMGKLGRIIEKSSKYTNFISDDEKMMLNRKYFIGLYDTYLNSRNGLKILKQITKLPCLRIYREEDGKKGYFKQRCGMKSIEKMVNFLIDHSYEDFMVESYDI